MRKIRVIDIFNPEIYYNVDFIYKGKYNSYRYINRRFFGILLNFIGR